MYSTDTEQSNSQQYRSTDPLTSKMARKSDTLEARILSVLLTVGPCTSWELVTHLNEQRDSYTHDREPREVTIDSVSTCMRPMCRLGEVHEEGMKENTVRGTGNKVIVWAAGPSPDWQPGRSMPAARTREPRRPSFECFFPEDIEKLNLSVGQDLERFTLALNKAIMERLHA